MTRSAEFHLAGGDTIRGRELLERAIERHSPGPRRAQLLLRLARVRYIDDDVVAANQLLQQTLTEAGEDTYLVAATEQELAFTAMFGGDIPRALGHAESSLRLADQLGDRGLLALALCRVALVRCLAGQGLDRQMMERAVLLEEHIDEVPVEWSASYALAGTVAWIGEFETSRGLYTELYQAALERGDERTIPTILFAMSQLESMVGNLEPASRYAVEAVERSRQSGLASLQASSLSAQTLASALLGQSAAARAAAQEGFRSLHGPVPPRRLPG